ncbi:hypothetical protein BST81_00580 [Leptolyngbya sp. 'hensonii']|uniref:DUF433 domain-containing protein n=1 Tax=Leptolyngbya sp. 'hensonii' TaxID=1922337 RepID=UPI00094F86AB|nr:DUF433 domain-containing protein [Leptolyngbya sp. 'hensonii']OLP20413.1 hypothetical protein BST81_00580 [Leptolyngbya sp. 'hensonii']
MTFKDHKLDFRNIPTYSIVDAARYLTIPVGTLRSWLQGRYYPVEDGKRFFEPLIQRPDPDIPQLSFTNLVEAHVLRAIREIHGVRLDKVRTALDYIDQQFDIPHPLARIEFQTDGISLFIESMGRLINASEKGQLEMQNVLKHLLERIEWDKGGIAARLFPLTRIKDQNAPKILVIDPRISFGRPILTGTGIPTAILAERYKAGEAMDNLAEDYGCDRLQIEAAIRCELTMQQAA